MWLKILSGELKGRVIPLHSARLKIGRAKENDLILPDSQVGSLHAHLFSNQNGQWFMKSITPGNPLYVGQVKHNNTFTLQPGMVVRIGNTFVQFKVSLDQTSQEYVNSAQRPPIIEQPTSRPILPVLLGAGVGVLILGIVLLLVSNDMLALSEAQVATTNATATPTVTQTPTPTATATAIPLPTATAEPTMTPVPLLEPQLGEITQQEYRPDLLDPNLLQNLTWNRDLLLTVPISFTNHGTETIHYNDIQVGLFTKLGDTPIQVPSFFLNNNDGLDTIAPNDTHTLRWQIVLSRDLSLSAWKMIYKDIEVEQYLNP